MSNVTPFADYQRDMNRYDRDVAGARMGANLLSMHFPIASIASLANRIDADAEIASLAKWECDDLEYMAARLDEAARQLRRAAGFTQQLQAAE